MLYKNTLIKIKKSFGRYISLLIIVMLGAGFFMGIKESSPDIISTIDQYYKDHNLMDLKVISTMGLTDSDVDALRKLENVKSVVPSYSLDLLDQDKVIKVYAIEESMNTVKLIDGRMTESDTECLADSNKYKLGDKILISSEGNNKLKNIEYTVVGTIESPLYLSDDYGSTTIGDGKLSSYIFVNRDNFTMKAYTEIYIAVDYDNKIPAYSDDYDKIISSINDEINGMTAEREDARYQELVNMALGSVLNSQLNSGPNTQVNTEFNKQVNSEPNTQVAPELNTQFNSESNTQVNPELNAQLSPDLNTQLNLIKSQVEKPKWYIDDRDSIPGYNIFQLGTDTITSLADIFPLFFIVIVILMTSNTMARMIVEERSELGTLTSLGYKNSSIISTYLIYVLSATLLGAISGFFVGCSIIPKIIYSTFKYTSPPLILQYDMVSLLMIILVDIILMAGVVLFFCNMELKQKPAFLLRPVPPKHGQKILLERVGIIWRHLSFTWKVTLRNIFRYKQRVFMTIVGIAGGAALLITGFGLRDSFSGVVDKQYNDIFKYHALMVLKNEVQNVDQDMENLLLTEKADQPAFINQTAFKVASDDKSLNTYLITPENNELFKQYYNLKDSSTKTDIEFDDNSVIITQKLASFMDIGKGDTIQIQDANNVSYSLVVSDVAENYINHYIYISKSMYSKVFGADVSYNMIVSNYNQDKSTFSEHLMESGSILNVTFQEDIIKKASDANKSLNNVVVLIVVITSVLVVIILYNLTSINISERKREIATLKVLGFYDKEANQYIYREAFMLTLLSIGVGLIAGIYFHRFLIGFIEGDDNVYFRNIHGISFVWVILIIIIFSVIMQIVTYFKMKKIDMIESLKSVE